MPALERWRRPERHSPGISLSWKRQTSTPDFSRWHLQHKTNVSHHPEQYPGQGSFRPAVATYYARHGEEQLLATLSALTFPMAEGPIEAFLQVEDLQKQSLIKLHDAAIVYWPAGGESPKLK